MSDQDLRALEQAHAAGNGFAVGQRLQSVRLANGLSQRELARRAKITNGSLSLIEQGKVSPSIGSLEKILQAIPMSLPEFFAETPQTPVVCKAKDWMVIQEGPARMRVMALGSVADRERYLVECELPAQSRETRGPLLGASSANYAGKSGQIAGTVLEGRLVLRIDGVCHHLASGDGFQFASHKRHQFVNDSDGLCSFMLVAQMAN